MAGYLSHSVRLSLVVMLINAESGIKGTDLAMLNQLAFYNKRVQLVFSKVDKVKGREVLNTNLEKTSMQI